MHVYKVPETVIGFGSVNQLGSLMKERGKQRPLILCDHSLKELGLVDEAFSGLRDAGLKFELFTDIEPELPVEAIEKAYEVAKEADIDSIIAIGGGSCIDTAKIISVMVVNEQSVNDMVGTGNVAGPGLFTAAIPTTAGTGAEVTPNAIIKWSDENRKDSIVSPFIIPHLVILDASLTITLPAHLTAWTGIDALTHAIESFTAKRANPYSDMYAREAIRLIGQSMRRAVYHPNDLEAREKMLFGSFLAGFCITHAGTGAVHALAYPLGGTYHVQHGLSNAIFLSEVMAVNLPACIDKYSEIALLLGHGKKGRARVMAEHAVELVDQLCIDVGIDESRKTIPVRQENIPALSEEAYSIRRLMDNNPRPLTVTQVQGVYERVFLDDVNE